MQEVITLVEITETWIDSEAPNSVAIKNGQGFVKKKKFLELHRSLDGSVLFGICAGSGSSNYEPSADFAVPEKPVMRCTCPSRQFPCKHVLGLLYSYAGGETFTEAEVPEELAAKREKAEKREAKKKEDLAGDASSSKPKKVNKSALKKKITAQLEGLDVLETLVLSLVRNGLGTVDHKERKMIQDHVKQMGSYYLSGAQTELRRLWLFLSHEEKEISYTYAAEQLAVLQAMIKKGRAHLQSRLEDPELALDHESTMEEWLGHAWQLSELHACGLVDEDAELVQLSFFSYDDLARQEYVDTGYWIQKESGEIHRTVQYRPYKAAKLMREDDSFFDVAQIPLLYRYPGEMNRRVRFEDMKTRLLSEKDFTWIGAHAHKSYPEAIKAVKNQLKNPLSVKTPVVLLDVKQVAVSDAEQYAIISEAGDAIGLGDVYHEPTTPLLRFLPPEALQNVKMLVMFELDLMSGRLLAQPLTIITDQEIIRLLY